jgi:uncharacterized membrane protein
MADSRVCPYCGAQEASNSADASATGGLEQNVAGVLCYLVGWISGLIFLLIDKRPFVRFHGAQSIALFLACMAAWIGFWIITLVLGFITTLMGLPIGFLVGFLFPLVIIGSFVAFIFCMYKAYNNEKYKLPIIGNMVERMVG